MCPLRLLFMLQGGCRGTAKGRKKERWRKKHAHLWWAVLSRPCGGALLVSLHEGWEKDSDSRRSTGGCRLNSGGQPAGCWFVVLLQRSPSLSLSVCVCVSLKGLPSSFHCCSSGCSLGCVARPLSRLLSWCVTIGCFFWGDAGLSGQVFSAHFTLQVAHLNNTYNMLNRAEFVLWG